MKSFKFAKYTSSNLSSQFSKMEPLYYHQYPTPGKLTVRSTKPMGNIKDLSLAYSPGVAVPCMEIHNNPLDVYKYTNKANMVAIVTNGTAVLGLGNIGARAAKPVMEGKAVIYNTFAGIEAVDVCIDSEDPDTVIKVVKSMAPSFGGINLEDIQSPDCYYIEREL